MILDIIAHRLALPPQFPTVVLVFFAYSLLGYYLECVVLTIDKRRLVIDRGFASHMPFCIIYGFGGMLMFGLLAPFKDNLIALFLLGAAGATAFELLTAKLQQRIFGDFWWDYTNKPFNYKGMLCLESTIGWGFAAIIVVHFLHRPLVWLVGRIPGQLAAPLAVLLLAAYLADFILSARAASRQRRQEGESCSFENNRNR